MTLVDRIQEKRLQWFGHVERMKTDRLPVKALHTTIEGKRSRGRQRKRWIDNLTADIKETGSCMQMAKELVHNRKEWRSLTIQPHVNDGREKRRSSQRWGTLDLHHICGGHRPVIGKQMKTLWLLKPCIQLDSISHRPSADLSRQYIVTYTSAPCFQSVCLI